MISERVRFLKDEINALPSVYEGTAYKGRPLPAYTGEEPFHDVWMANPDKPFDIRLAMAQAAWRASVHPVPEPHQLFAGSLLPQSIIRYATGVFEWDFILDESLAPQNPRGDGIVSYWKAYLESRPPRGKYENPSDAFHHTFQIFHMSCHSTMDFSMVMEGGINALREKVRNHMPLHPESAEWYEAVHIALDGACRYIRAHADAYEAAAATAEPALAAEYSAIAAICRNLADGNAPASFREACQLFWFLFYLNGHDSPGRIDRYLGPALQRDLDHGVLTMEEAQELCDCLYCKMAKQVAYGSTLGGQTPEGGDSTNAMTWLCLNSIRRLKLLSPRTALRVHKHTPPALLEEALRTCAEGATYPTFVNDEAVLPTMLCRGSSLEDARDYTFCGCGQVVHNGKAFGGHEELVLNAPKLLNLTLHRGKDELTGEAMGLDAGGIAMFETYEDLEFAVLRQITHALALMTEEIRLARQWGARYIPDFLRSALVHGCVENGKDFRRGGAKYHAGMMDVVGVTTLSDSLAAIRRVVFEDHICTLQELSDAMDANWEGHEDLYQACLHAPKFGNDDDAADLLNAKLVHYISDDLYRRDTLFGGHWGIDINGWSGAVELGAYTGATPDGRRRGEPLADCAGPAQGRDVCGATAVLHSMAKLPFAETHGPLVLSMKFSPRTVLGENLPRLRDLLKTYFSMGGMQFQPTVVNADDLRAARENPEAWRDLIVRVGGFSARFVDLLPPWQEDMIRRTENGL